MADLEQTPVATEPGHRRRPAPRRAWTTSFTVVLVLMAACMAMVRGFNGDPRLVPPLTTVRLIAGSESEPLLTDRDMLAAFRNHGFDVRVDPEGSRQMARDRRTCGSYDLALPSSQPVADEIAQACNPPYSHYPVFTSPMVVVTFSDIVPLLSGPLHIATFDRASQTWSFDLHQYITVVDSGQRWKTVPGNTTYRYSGNRVLLSTTDPRTSNSAAMYAALLSYALNNDSPVSTDQQVQAQLPRIRQEFFEAQGYKLPSSEWSLAALISSLGEARMPMSLLYEAQFIDLENYYPDTIRRLGLVAMYPTPTAIADHAAVPMTAVGDQIAKLLDGENYDPAIMHVEAEHGWRTQDPGQTFSRTAHQLPEPAPSNIDAAPPPDYQYFEELLNGL